MIEFRINEHQAADDGARRALACALSVIERLSFSDPWSADAFLESMQNSVICYFTAYEDIALIAYAIFAKIAPEAELLNLAVHPDKRKCGLADTLLERAFSKLREDGVSELFLEVRESNTPARTLYAKKGFVPIARRKQYYRYPTEDAIVMMSHLD